MSVFVPVFVRLGAYALIFHIRRHRVTPLTILVLACAPLIPAVIGLSGFLGSLAGMGLALWIISQYTKIDVFPAGLLIVAAVEVSTWVVIHYGILPFVP